eukprot:g3677.t1
MDALASLTAVGVALLLMSFWLLRQQASARSTLSPRAGGWEADFDGLRRRYLLGFVPAMLADWMMGGHIYALYAAHGYSMDEIAVLFLVGFGASMALGTALGSASDSMGRARACRLYCALYAVSAVCNNSPSWGMLVLSRITGGAATSLLYCCFEVWAVDEHARLNLPRRTLERLFAEATLLNACSAVAGGLLAEAAVHYGGLTAPFNCALLPLGVSALAVGTRWRDNYGERAIGTTAALAKAAVLILRTPLLIATGVLSAAFEGVMYVFVFMWTPALEARHGPASAGAALLPHGIVFALLMLWKMLGSNAFALLSHAGRGTHPITVTAVFALAALSLFAPVRSGSFGAALAAFAVYEFCIGMYWPTIGVLRSRHVPQAARATINTLFRVPLNMGVMVALSHVGRQPEWLVFSGCTLVLVLAATMYMVVASWPRSAGVRLKPSRSEHNVRLFEEYV